MTNKLVFIINSLKVPKIKKILLYEISCTKLQLPPEPLTRGLPPPVPRSLCPLSSTEFVETPLPHKIPGYATALYAPATPSTINSHYSFTLPYKIKPKVRIMKAFIM